MVITFAAGQYVIVITAIDVVIAAISGNRISAFAAHQLIIAEAAEQHVLTGISSQEIITGRARANVIPCQQEQAIIAVAPVDEIIAERADENIITRPTNDEARDVSDADFIAIGEAQIFNPLERIRKPVLHQQLRARCFVDPRGGVFLHHDHKQAVGIDRIALEHDIAHVDTLTKADRVRSADESAVLCQAWRVPPCPVAAYGPC